MNPVRRRLLAGGIVVGIVAGGAGAALADSTSTSPVTVTALSGTRTLSLTDITGSALGALTLGTGHAGAFLANVTDVGYKNAGYQVTAEMSDLYPYSAGTYNFAGTPISSANVNLGFSGTNPLDLNNIGELVTPVIDLTGSLTNLAGSLETSLGLGSLGALNSTVDTTLDTTIDGTATTVNNLASNILNGVASDLPIQVQTGATGAFTSSGPLTGVTQTGAPTGSASPTTLSVMSGTPNSVSGLLGDLLTQLGADANKAVPLSALITDGVVTQTDVLTAIQSATGIPTSFLASSTNVTNLLNDVTATVTSIAGVLGQTGSYNALPLLNVSVPSDTASGTYRGVLTVALKDLPNT